MVNITLLQKPFQVSLFWRRYWLILSLIMTSEGKSSNVQTSANEEAQISTHGIASFDSLASLDKPLNQIIPNAASSGEVIIVAGGTHTCNLTSGGGVRCWGENIYGQLGDGTNDRSSEPKDVVGLDSGITSISLGYGHTCAITINGEAKCWGKNDYGELGDGTTTRRSSPIDVVGLGIGVRALTGGAAHTCALTTGGGVKCWGYNGYGQLGDGTNTDRLTPVGVVGLTSGITAIAAGGLHTCGLTTAGGVKCWGENESGGLGDGTTTNSSTPVDVVGLTSGITAIAAGSQHTCALTTGGGVKCWGYNGYGQLGDGTNTDRLTPVDVVGLPSGITAIAAGSQHTCALTDNGGILCWGLNSVGQLGNGTIINSSIPVNISGLLSGMTAVTAGASQSCSLTSSGGVKIWGGVPFICGGYLVPADWEGL